MRRKAKAVYFSGFVAKAELWDKGVPLRSQMLGVYHASSGYAVASDGHILVYDKRQYNANRQGTDCSTKEHKERFVHAEKESKRYGGLTDGKTPMQAASIAKVLSEILLGNDC